MVELPALVPVPGHPASREQTNWLRGSARRELCSISGLLRRSIMMQYIIYFYVLLYTLYTFYVLLYTLFTGLVEQASHGRAPRTSARSARPMLAAQRLT